MFLLHEKVVYPGYGVAVINRLVERLVVNKKTNFFELKFYNKDMTVLIPEDRLESIGVRKLSTLVEVEKMFHHLSNFSARDIITEHNASTWNKRNKEYQSKLRSGLLFQISSIYKELNLINLDKELSFGERNLFNQIEFLLIEEVSSINDETVENLRLKLRHPFEVMEQTLKSRIFTKNNHHANASSQPSHNVMPHITSAGKAEALL